MIAESFLYQANHAISPFLSLNTWSYIEIIIALILFSMCLYARVSDAKFSSMNNRSYSQTKDNNINEKNLHYTRGFLETKTIQFGLFLQMLIAMFAVVDGYQIQITKSEPHIMLIVLLFSSICIKADLIIPSLKPEFTVFKKVLDRIR